MSTLLDWLSSKYPTAKRQTLRRMVEDGRVSVNGQAARSVKAAVAETDEVRVDERPERPKTLLEPLKVVHEDADILAVFKPAGLITSSTPREPRATAIGIIREYLAEREPRARVGVIHRLDRDASGLLVFSKNNDAYENLKRQFFEHSVQRIYMAVVHGTPNPPAGRIESDLVELTDGSMRTTRVRGKGEHAITDYEVIKTVGKLSLLRVKLETGKKHQIRAHLSQKGWPIVGDSMYGELKDEKSPLLLAATMLVIDHPATGQRMTFEIPLPPQMAKAIE